ncbi:hypothetical protein BH10ACI2_BH10ACI2_04900 [soil metagenome]
MKSTLFIAFSIFTIFTLSVFDTNAQSKSSKTTAKQTAAAKAKKPLTAKEKKAAEDKKKADAAKAKKAAQAKGKKPAPTKDKKPVVAKAKPVVPAAPTPAVPSAGAIKTKSGLIYIITKKGSGRLPKVGETVAVHYTGTLTDGVKFDSSRDAGKPYAFPLGKGRVIAGWDEGIGKLHVGDHAILILPPSLGYGVRGAGNGAIPPNATLVFVVELVEIK